MAIKYVGLVWVVYGTRAEGISAVNRSGKEI